VRRVELRYLDLPIDVLWERVRTRGREEALSGRAIEREELFAWFDAFDEPDGDELGGYDAPVDGTYRRPT